MAQMVTEGVGDFLRVWRQRSCLIKERHLPAAEHQSQRVVEGGERFGILRGLAA
jgi:hypothetical protein